MSDERTRRQRILLAIGSLGPLGHVPASGTVTVALVGIPGFCLLHTWQPATLAAFCAVFFLASVWLHGLGDRILGEKDSRTLVWDELAGFWIALFALPFSWPIACAAVLVERAIDIAKVPPADVIERRWPGGWGVVGDDLVAGAYTCLILHGLIRSFPDLMGVS